jgi:hypothetical protein
MITHLKPERVKRALTDAQKADKKALDKEKRRIKQAENEAIFLTLMGGMGLHFVGGKGHEVDFNTDSSVRTPDRYVEVKDKTRKKKDGTVVLIQKGGVKLVPGKRKAWRFDFACLEHKIAVEVEGGTFVGTSRHTSKSGFREDMWKYNEAAAQGWCVLRCFPETLLSEQLKQQIFKAWKMREKQ